MSPISKISIIDISRKNSEDENGRSLRLMSDDAFYYLSGVVKNGHLTINHAEAKRHGQSIQMSEVAMNKIVNSAASIVNGLGGVDNINSVTKGISFTLPGPKRRAEDLTAADLVSILSNSNIDWRKLNTAEDVSRVFSKLGVKLGDATQSNIVNALGQVNKGSQANEHSLFLALVDEQKYSSEKPSQDFAGRPTLTPSFSMKREEERRVKPRFF